MNRTITKWGIALSSAAMMQPGSAQEVQLFNGFETAAELAAAFPNGTQVQPTKDHVTQGGQALRIEFQPGGDWPNVTFAAPTPWDWQKWGVLVVDVTNPGTEMVEVGIGAGDAPETGTKGWSSGLSTLAPGSKATLGFPLTPPAQGAPTQDIGMDGMPSQVPNLMQMRAWGQNLDLKRIALFTIFSRSPKTATSVIVDNIRLAPAPQLTGIVDKYGQYTGATWPGKASQDADLIKARTAEEADWKTYSPKGVNKFGGWTGGPQLKATGYFRTEKRDGKWWLVDPEGRPFFSTGITTINYNEPLDQYTRVTGRESLFSWLPDTSKPFDARHTSIRGDQRYFNFYTSNLERKYGAEYPKAWLSTTKSRLTSWGFNTVGAFSTPITYTLGIPYTINMGAWGGHQRVKGENIDIDDPFDPQFATDLANNLRNLAPKAPSDPFCIGYYVDNELTWGGNASERERYSIARSVLAATPDLPAKKAFIAQLRKSYTDIAALNTRWGTNLTNWEALQAPFTPDWKQEAAMKEDLATFMKAFADQYYRTVRDTIKAYDPNHLYLGDKYMVARYTPEALQAAQTYCDVVSFDIYEADLATEKWDFLKNLDKPCIIGEFHFGALDRGMFGAGMISVANQEQRGAAYERYVRSAAEHPAFVGTHWFQYLDEPLTGRAFDRENHNVGFVNVLDTPYPELVTAARRANEQVYNWRSK